MYKAVTLGNLMLHFYVLNVVQKGVQIWWVPNILKLLGWSLKLGDLC